MRSPPAAGSSARLDASLHEQCRLLNQVLFQGAGLRGNREDYADPRNSLLDQVLTRHLGSPILLDGLPCSSPRRLAWSSSSVGVPGYFSVGHHPGLYIDVQRGQILAPDDVFARLRQENHLPQLS